MSKTHIIELKLLRPDILNSLPKYSTSGSAAIDLRAAIKKSVKVSPGSCKLIPTGISIHLDDPCLAGIILPRSGLGHKQGLILGNSVGLIDSDYQGELMVSCWNRSNDFIEIEPLVRFAQFAIVPIVKANFIRVEEFSYKSRRGTGGFGHTGIN